MRVIDLVCGKELVDAEVAWVATFGDDTFFFCSAECRDEFEQHPEEHLDQEALLVAAEA